MSVEVTGFRVSGFGFRVSSFGIRVWSSGRWVQGLGFTWSTCEPLNPAALISASTEPDHAGATLISRSNVTSTCVFPYENNPMINFIPFPVVFSVVGVLCRKMDRVLRCKPSNHPVGFRAGNAPVSVSLSVGTPLCMYGLPTVGS